MQWEFTPADLVKGEVEYGLEAFRRDLAREVAMNVGSGDRAALRRAYQAVYDQCYWLATGKPLGTLLAAFEDDPEMRDWLASLAPLLQPNVDMLGAILQREIMDRMAGGEPLDRALENVSRRHDELGRSDPGELLLAAPG